MESAEAVARVGGNVAVIANTVKLTKKDARELRSSLEAQGIADPHWIDVRHGSESKKAAAKAAKRGVHTVVVCGGDGTVRAAAEGLVGTKTALSVVPRGT